MCVFRGRGGGRGYSGTKIYAVSKKRSFEASVNMDTNESVIPKAMENCLTRKTAHDGGCKLADSVKVKKRTFEREVIPINKNLSLI